MRFTWVGSSCKRTKQHVQSTLVNECTCPVSNSWAEVTCIHVLEDYNPLAMSYFVHVLLIRIFVIIIVDCGFECLLIENTHPLLPFDKLSILYYV